MFAVIKTGGKQYRVAKDDVLEIEKIEGKPGAKISFAEVLLVGGGAKPQLGSPLLKGASVEAEIVAQDRGDKISVVKKRRRKGYHRHKGHRQLFTKVKITGITAEKESARHGA